MTRTKTISLIALVGGLLGFGVWLAWDRGWLRVVGLPMGSEHDSHEAGGEEMEDMPGMPGMKMPKKSMAEGEDEVGLPGYAAVVIEPGIQQRIGVTLGKVGMEPLRMSVKTIGIVQPNETATARIHLKTEGWVEELYVNFTGQKVEEGGPMLAIYSPEFLQAQEEYIIAREAERGGTLPGRSRRSLSASTLRKLELWDVPQEEIRELEQSGKPKKNLTLRSPITGTVLEKNVLEEEYVTPQREVYVISDLSTVWVQAKVYQYELPHIEVGKPATVIVAGLPGRRFEGRVVFIQPTVEAMTRTVQVRVELPNPEGLLKPDMFVQVEIQHPMGDGLLIPMSAVIRTGERDIVFRKEKGNRFIPTEVEVGQFKFGDAFHVLRGLSAGDVVVTSANFLIDSESRLRAGGAMGGMEMDMPGMEKEGADHSKMKH